MIEEYKIINTSYWWTVFQEEQDTQPECSQKMAEAMGIQETAVSDPGEKFKDGIAENQKPQ